MINWRSVKLLSLSPFAKQHREAKFAGIPFAHDGVNYK